VADRWLAQTPDNFLFGFRRTQADQPFPTATVCETRKPGWASSDWRYARSRINRLGPVLFQLPRTFTIDPAVLEDFLRNWPRGLRVSFEFRHPSWFTDALMKFCAIIGRDFVWPKGMRWQHREF